MALAVRYTNVDGRTVKENRGGTKRGYVPDTLGSTIALVDSNGTVTDTWEYWPYGEVASRTGTNPTPFTFVGTLGYFKDLVSSLTYVRARFYQALIGQWMTKDPLPGSALGYQYRNSPVVDADPSGLLSYEDCYVLCGVACFFAPELCLQCMNLCLAASDIEEFKKELRKIMKRRSNCSNPQNDFDCFLCPGKGGHGAPKCAQCCEKRHPDQDDESRWRCDCYCDKYFTNPERNDCAPYPKPKPPKPKPPIKGTCHPIGGRAGASGGGTRIIPYGAHPRGSSIVWD